MIPNVFVCFSTVFISSLFNLDGTSLQETCWLQPKSDRYSGSGKGEESQLRKAVHKTPSLENYFGHPLLLWIPWKLWQVKLTCPHPDCQKDLLTSAGLHQKIRWLPWVRCTLWHLCTWPAEDVRKPAGSSYGTATWATNVGNKNGQVIMSVLTASEGFGLGPMIEGLIKRYRVAGLALPRYGVLTETAVATLFWGGCLKSGSKWPSG